MNIKPGDKLTFEVKTIGHVINDEVTLEFKDGRPGWLHVIKIVAIKHHEPAPDPIKIGDKVRNKVFPGVFRVAGLDGGFVWADDLNGNYKTLTLSYCYKVT